VSTNDQFPHDDCPRDKDQPLQRKGTRLVHASLALPYVRLSISPLAGERHTLTVQQAIALIRELADAVHDAEPCPASEDLWHEADSACQVWEVKDND
jgi:hypothetical protein